MKNLIQKIKIGILGAALSFGIAGLSEAQDFSMYKSVHLVRQESSSIGSLEIYDALEPSGIDKMGDVSITIDVLREGNTIVQYSDDDAGEYMYITEPGTTMRIYKMFDDPPWTEVKINDKFYYSTKQEDQEEIQEGEAVFKKYLQDIKDIKAAN